jgi:hypothetical protein
MSVHFGTFLKQIDVTLYSQYSFERYAEGAAPNKPHKDPKLTFTEPVFEFKKERLIDSLLDRLDTLPADNVAVKYCQDRKIPETQLKRLYYIDDIKKIEQLSEKAKGKVQGNEPRLVMPFYDTNGQLTGVTCRALGDEKLRYIIVKVKEDTPLIFGLDDHDSKQHTYVVEGPIDSLFLPNAIAVSGTGFGKLDYLNIPKDLMTVIVDNQPRNKEVCKIIESLITKDYNVVIWPQTLEEKDINQIILAGKSQNFVLKTIKENTHRGLKARANFMAWKRC